MRCSCYDGEGGQAGIMQPSIAPAGEVAVTGGVDEEKDKRPCEQNEGCISGELSAIKKTM